MDAGSFITSAVFGAVLILPLVAIFFLKDRLPMWPGRRIISMYIHRLKQDESPDDTGRITEEQLEVVGEKKIWKINQGKIPYFWVQTKGLNGFLMDYKAFASVRNIINKPCLRVWEKVPELEEGQNYVPIDIPSEMPHTKYKSDLSNRGKIMVRDIAKAYARGDSSPLWLQTVLPILAILAVIMVAIFSFDFLTKTLESSTNAYISSVRDSSYLIASTCGEVPDNFIPPSQQNQHPNLNNSIIGNLG